MLLNQKVRVSSKHPFHADRIGYFQFYGTGPSEGCIILAEKPNSDPKTLFVVGPSDIELQ